MVERVADRAVDLWDTAERVRVLDLVARRLVAGLEPRIAEQVPELRRDRDLSGVRPGELIGGRKGNVGAQERLDGHRGGHARATGQSIRVREQERPDRGHQLGPVEEGEALLRPEDDRLEADLAEPDQGRHVVAVELDLAPTDQGQRQVGERREVARRPDRALGRDDGMEIPGEEIEQPFDEERPAAGVAERERVRPEQEHRANDLARQRLADAGGMAHQEVLLEPLRVGRRDELRREVAEPGRDAVDDLAAGDEAVDQVARLLHPAARGLVEDDGGAVAGDRLDVGDRQVGPRQDDRVGRDGALRVGHGSQDSQISSARSYPCRPPALPILPA